MRNNKDTIKQVVSLMRLLNSRQEQLYFFLLENAVPEEGTEDYICTLELTDIMKAIGCRSRQTAYTNLHKLEDYLLIFFIDKPKSKYRQYKIRVYSEIQSQKNTPQKVVRLFNSICKSYPPVKILTSKRIELLNILIERYTENYFRDVFIKMEKNHYLKGGGKDGWVASFDWIIVEDNFVKTAENNYMSILPSKSTNDVNKVWKKRTNAFIEDEENEI